MRLRLNGSEEDYRRMISEGRAQLHRFPMGFAITEVRGYTHPTEKVLNVLILGGERFDEWKEVAHNKLKEFARVNGCSAIEFACRLGLFEKIKDLGYSRKRVLARYEIGHEQTILEKLRHSAAA